ncbi:MAG: Rpn family recombination-promoting nuclease/putative transposase [Lachnospiraceae bacterium]|nr:Rpn family recombination-promoting nuclease/putative transposase [Lachnospiraceae bacterium]
MTVNNVTHAKKIVPLQELNLTSRFLFSEVSEDPVIHQDILSIALQETVTLRKQNTVEKQLQKLPQIKSVRLDVYSMDEESNVYNTEMQQFRKSDLQKRSRFYQAMIDTSLLPVGSISYNELNNSYIIMITPFDLFGKDLYRYTFLPECQEAPGIKLEDGATRIFLNTKGKHPEDISPELVEFLKYVENTDDATAQHSNSERIKRIHKRVQEIKASEEIGVKYMQAWEEKAYEREEGREEGRKEGAKLTKIKQIQVKYAKQLPEELIAEHLEMELSFVHQVCEIIRANPDADAEEIYSVLSNTI